MLRRELVFLYTKWNDYKTLYCKTDEAIDLLNSAAPFFFQIYCAVLQDDIIMTVCRLTDPAKSIVGGATKENLTVKYLVSIIPSTESNLHQALDSKLKVVDAKCKEFRAHRNRRIGHYDLDTRLKRANRPLCGIGINEAEDTLLAIADILNAIERHYDSNEQNYAEGISATGGSDELLEFIRRKNALEKYFNNKEFGDQFTVD